jgi:hypothetical protein
LILVHNESSFPKKICSCLRSPYGQKSSAAGQSRENYFHFDGAIPSEPACAYKRGLE